MADVMNFLMVHSFAILAVHFMSCSRKHAQVAIERLQEVVSILGQTLL